MVRRPEDPLKAKISDKVERLVRIPEGRGKLFRLAWAGAGIVVVLAGVAMTVFPGPAIIVIPVGLAMIAGIFSGVRRLVETSIDRGVDMERWVAALDLHVKVLAALAVVALVAAIGALVVL